MWHHIVKKQNGGSGQKTDFLLLNNIMQICLKGSSLVLEEYYKADVR